MSSQLEICAGQRKWEEARSFCVLSGHVSLSTRVFINLDVL